MKTKTTRMNVRNEQTQMEEWWDDDDMKITKYQNQYLHRLKSRTFWVNSSRRTTIRKFCVAITLQIKR